jgi:hypothetical protein
MAGPMRLGLRAGDIVNRTRALIKGSAATEGTDSAS